MGCVGGGVRWAARVPGCQAPSTLRQRTLKCPPTKQPTGPPSPTSAQVIKRVGVQMQQRQVPPPAVATWQGRMEALEPQVEAVIAEEREERALRKAEMEAQKVRCCCGWHCCV